MDSDDHHHHHHHHLHIHKPKVLEKLSNKISSLKEDITEAVRDRTHSTTSDHRGSISTDNISILANNASLTLPDDIPSVNLENRQTFKGYGDTDSIASSQSMTSYASSAGVPHSAPPRHTIDQLALNMGFGGIRPLAANPSILSTSTTHASSASLVNSANPVFQPTLTPTSLKTFDLSDNISLNKETFNETEDNVKERNITKIDPVEMVAEPTVVTVSKDPVRRAATLLAGPKFRVNCSEDIKKKVIIDNNTIYTVAIIVGILSLIFSLWKPISSYFSGLMVGILFAGAIVYILFRLYINAKTEEKGIEEWVDFPTLEAMLTKCDKEDKNTNIQVTGASIAFQSYDADRDEDFVRYPCDIRLDGYRLIIQLASKQWSEDKKSDKEVKFIGYREYLIKEAGMILVPEATLTRAKYWMNDYPIVVQDLQILDKQINSKQQLEKSKLDTNDFFTNTATTLSIWFETCPQKEEWFHKLSLVLRKGKEEIERTNNLTTGKNNSGDTTPSLHRRLPQTDADIELVPNVITEADVNAAIVETEANAEEFHEKAQFERTGPHINETIDSLRVRITAPLDFTAEEVDPDDIEKDITGTKRTIVRKSRKTTPSEASLQHVLQSPECLDETAITINFLARRLLCDMFEIPVFKDLIKDKVEMKLKEVAVKIFKDLRVTSIDIGNTFPIILKVEPMQWNTQGIWFNLFLHYRGNVKLSVRSRVLLQKLINYDPKKHKPMFAQHHSAQLVHKDEERIDEDDLVQRQKLLAKEPEIPEMAVTRKLGLALTSLALNPYFQMFANIPFVKKLFEKFSEKEIGADIEVTGFSGTLTLNIPPPPSDRIWVGFPEMPDLTIKVVPVYGEKQYQYTLLEDFLSARIRDEIKRLVVLPAMDDQLLPFFRDWAIDIIGEIVSKPINPLTDNYKAKLNALASVRAGLDEYNNMNDVHKQTPPPSPTAPIAPTLSSLAPHHA
ncbi:unnamed protein product [Adineta steineri]|uniref:SMP-LTD domain-containing protein n=1 Tax=Adineta steineri TaxID=433720 RepID=A0A819CF32_9BILA|nr:unnamed protein product [Adineta steineri]CAF3806698.1 unnamed protein product [Adineta steineri]